MVMWLNVLKTTRRINVNLISYDYHNRGQKHKLDHYMIYVYNTTLDSFGYSTEEFLNTSVYSLARFLKDKKSSWSFRQFFFFFFEKYSISKKVVNIKTKVATIVFSVPSPPSFLPVPSIPAFSRSHSFSFLSVIFWKIRRKN